MGSSEDAQQSKALVERILRGDRQAEEQMVKLYQEGLRQILISKLYKGSEDILEDVIQDTWQVALRHLRADKLQDPEKLRVFIVGIGVKQLYGHVRKVKAHFMDSDEGLELEANETDEPYRSLEISKTRQLVSRLINKLKTPRDRALIKSIYLQEQSKESICENHQLDELHYNRVTHRARNRFKKVWEEEENNE